MPLVLILFAILGLIPVQQVHALAHGEFLETRAVAYLAQYQIVMLDRGTSDDIMPNSHLKLYSGDRFVARAYSIEVNLFRSTWIVYQIFSDTPLAEKLPLRAQKIGNHMVPKAIMARVKGLKVEEVNSALSGLIQDDQSPQFENVLKFGYKEDGKEDSETIKITETGGEISLNPNVSIDEETGQEEVLEDNFNMSINASPVRFTRINREKEIAYNTSVSSMNWGQKELAASYSYSTTTSKPAQFGPGSETVVTTSNYLASINFDYNKFWKDLTYFMFVSFERSRDGIIYPLRHRWSGGIAGIKWDIYESEKLPELSISYIPLLEYAKQDFLSFRTTCCDADGFETSEDFIEQVKTQKSRHSFRFKLSYVPIQNLTVSNITWYKPFHDFANKELDLRDNLFSNSFSISYATENNVSMSYQNEITSDITLKRLQGLPSTNMSHIFNLGYSFTF
jgi:hypothetical protein